jgi:hypothetical protein
MGRMPRVDAEKAIRELIDKCEKSERMNIDV